jgi:hypothetical protein
MLAPAPAYGAERGPPERHRLPGTVGQGSTIGGERRGRGSHVLDDDAEARRADPRYHRLMEATRAAAAHGYDAVSMRALAAEAQMSLTTVYQFCSSKDHLIAEAHAERMVAMRERVAQKPPKGRTPGNASCAWCGVSCAASIATIRWRGR